MVMFEPGHTKAMIFGDILDHSCIVAYLGNSLVLAVEAIIDGIELEFYRDGEVIEIAPNGRDLSVYLSEFSVYFRKLIIYTLKPIIEEMFDAL
jgi:hypothetical protein